MLLSLVQSISSLHSSELLGTPVAATQLVALHYHCIDDAEEDRCRYQ